MGKENRFRFAVMANSEDGLEVIDSSGYWQSGDVPAKRFTREKAIAFAKNVRATQLSDWLHNVRVVELTTRTPLRIRLAIQAERRKDIEEECARDRAYFGMG